MLRHLSINAQYDSELGRMRELERLIAWMHTIVLAPVVLICLLQFRFDQPQMLTPVILGVTTLVSWIVLSRTPTLRSLRALGIFALVADSLLLIVSMFLFDNDPKIERGIYFCLVLVLVSAAVRFQFWGGLISGVVCAAATAVWTINFQRDGLDSAVDYGSVAMRAMVFIVLGIIVGIIIQGLENARSSLRQRAQQSELITRFALDAPQRSETDNIEALAQMVYDELDCSGVWVFLFDPSTARLHVASYAGKNRAGVNAYPSGLSMSEHDHPVVQVFSSGSSNAQRDESGIEMVGVPLRAGGRTLGAILLALQPNASLHGAELRALDTLGAELAQVLENVRLGDVQRETISELRRLTELKDDFIAVASHELRTPLTAMRGFVRALRDVRANPEQSERAVQAIDRQVERMHRLVEDLLAVSMIDSGRAAQIPQAVVVREVADRCWQNLIVDTSRHELVLTIASDFPHISADPAFFTRVLENLLANAVQFSPEGGPVEVAARVEAISGGRFARIEVIDQGVGIRPEELDQLFEKFVRLPSNRRPEGTGLGLYIVSGLVKVMGGTTGVTSRPGAGSCFSFTVPLVAGAPIAKGSRVAAPDSAER
ncbi:MAG: GAF domain-containing sensor histidine kinase [Acidimicrobiia bacterium]